jgi:VCBS repeat-containing protein
MKQLLLILIFFSSVLFAGVGKVVSVKGDVSIERGTQSIKAEIGTILELKDRIITQDLSKAFIMMNDKTSITIGKKSNMAISEFVYDEKVAANNKASFNFGKGVFRTLTGGIGKLNKNKFKIKTKSASIGIRGTVFDVAVTDDKTKVGVIDGGIYYVDAKTAKTFEVAKNERLVYDDQTGEVTVEPGKLDESKDIENDDRELKEEKEKAEAKKKAEEEKAKKEKEEKERLAKEKKEKEEKEKLEREKKEKEEKERLEREKKEKAEKEKLEKEQKEKELQEKQNKDEEQEPAQNQENGEGEQGVAGENQDGTDEQNPPLATGENDEQGTPGAPEGTNPDGTNPDGIDGAGDLGDTTGDGFGLGEGDTLGFETEDGLETGAFNAEGTQAEVGFNNDGLEGVGTDNLGDTLEAVEGAGDAVEESSETANDLAEETNANAPEFTFDDAFTLDEDGSFSLELTATDEDGDTLEFAIVSESEHGTVTLNEETGTLEYVPNENFTGTDSVEVQVYDGKNIVKKTITFTVENTNDAPELTLPTETTLSEDGSLDVQLDASDLDGDTLIYSASEAQNGEITINEETGEITYTPNANFNGKEEITVSVTDGEEIVEQTLTFTVESVNDAPSLTIPTDTTLSEDGSLDLQLVANDVDNDTLTYELTSEAQNGQVSIDEDTGIVTFVPNPDFHGTEEVVVTVTDGVVTTEQTFSFTVESVNDIPIITEVTTQTILENDNSIFNLQGIDIDGDDVTYSVTNTIENGDVTIDETTGDITFTPNDNFFGTQLIEISITDGIETITTTVEIVVEEVVFKDELVADIPTTTLDEGIEAITYKIMNSDYSNSYMEFGRVGYDDGTGGPIIPTADEFYVTGDITPTEVIEQYIIDQNTIDYTGGISSSVANAGENMGTISLSVDFGNQNFTGSIFINNDAWDATINSGTVTKYGLDTSDITGTSNHGDITNGTLDGKFYGPYGDSVGGKFELNTNSSSVKGAYGASGI